MQYFYAILWFIVGLVLLFSLSKENKIFILAGGFFLFLGGWWLANALLPEIDLFAGTWGIVLRSVSGVALVILTAAFLREYRAGVRKKKEEESGKKGE